MSALRRRSRQRRACSIEFKRPALFTLATPVEVVLSGYEVAAPVAGRASAQDRMRRSGAFTDLRSSIEGGTPGNSDPFDQERASQLGLRVRDIADRVVASVRGDVATRYRWRDRKD